jgi:hypothetical protein
MWTVIRQSSENEWLQQEADRRLAQLGALDEIERLQQAVEAAARRIGQRPTDWQSLIRAGVFPGVPLDPARTPYEIGSDGTVGLSRTSPLWPLPEEPKAVALRPSA